MNRDEEDGNPLVSETRDTGFNSPVPDCLIKDFMAVIETAKRQMKIIETKVAGNPEASSRAWSINNLLQGVVVQSDCLLRTVRESNEDRPAIC
jgi:hypothetical protein